MATGRVRVSDVCGMAMLRDAELLGASIPPAHPVSGVVLVEPQEATTAEIPSRSVVVLPLDRPGAGVSGHLVDVLLRRVHNAGAAMLVVIGSDQPVPTATVSLAEWLGLPVLLASGATSAVELVVELRRLVTDPDVPRVEAIQAGLRQLPRGPRSPAEIRALLESLLPESNVAVIAGRGLAVEGSLHLVSAESVTSYVDETFVQHDDLLAVVLPLTGLDDTLSWWLVAERRRAGRLWLESASALMALVSGSLLTWLVREQAGQERDARMRATLLSEIIEHGDHPPPEVQELLARGGWQLGGWHTGLHLRFHPQDPSALAMRGVARDLAGLGLREDAFIERADGWVAWVTSATEPSLAQVREMGRLVERALSPPTGTRVVVGLGAPHRDAGGLGRTLAEARQACAIAGGGTKAVTVRVLQELGPSRLLLGWYASDALGDYSREILGGLLDDSEAEVLFTLRAYLERACSTAQTARALGLHRNTVSKRIARAESILGTTIATPDTRLALQLALRVLGS